MIFKTSDKDTKVIDFGSIGKNLLDAIGTQGLEYLLTEAGMAEITALNNKYKDVKENLVEAGAEITRLNKEHKERSSILEDQIRALNKKVDAYKDKEGEYNTALRVRRDMERRLMVCDSDIYAMRALITTYEDLIKTLAGQDKIPDYLGVEKEQLPQDTDYDNYVQEKGL